MKSSKDEIHILLAYNFSLKISDFLSDMFDIPDI